MPDSDLNDEQDGDTSSCSHIENENLQTVLATSLMDEKFRYRA